MAKILNRPVTVNKICVVDSNGDITHVLKGPPATGNASHPLWIDRQTLTTFKRCATHDRQVAPPPDYLQKIVGKPFDLLRHFSYKRACLQPLNINTHYAKTERR